MQAPGFVSAAVGPGRQTGGHHVRAKTGGRHRPAVLTGGNAGSFGGAAPPNKGLRFPADPPTVEEIIVVMREAGVGPYADRIRALIAILWRACGSAKTRGSSSPIWTGRPGWCWFVPGRAGSKGWSEWTSGAGSTSLAGPSTASSSRSARCSASSRDQPAAAAGRRQWRRSSVGRQRLQRIRILPFDPRAALTSSGCSARPIRSASPSNHPIT